MALQASCSDLVLEVRPEDAEELLRTLAELGREAGMRLEMARRGEYEYVPVDADPETLEARRRSRSVALVPPGAPRGARLALSKPGSECVNIGLEAWSRDGVYAVLSGGHYCLDSYPVLAMASLATGAWVCPEDGGSLATFIEWLDFIGAEYDDADFGRCVVVRSLPGGMERLYREVERFERVAW